MSEKSIVVAGTGGNIGSYFTPHLARMPEVGRATLIDRDVYETRNLVNQDIVPGDVKKPKALVQARRLASISTYDSAVRALRSFLAEAAPFTVQPRHAVNGVKS
jgi:tRNA A37 threonylcarbamoyladenosine dehydratase